jgi:hypothetical protein
MAGNGKRVAKQRKDFWQLAFIIYVGTTGKPGHVFIREIGHLFFIAMYEDISN